MGGMGSDLCVKTITLVFGQKVDSGGKEGWKLTEARCSGPGKVVNPAPTNFTGLEC